MISSHGEITNFLLLQKDSDLLHIKLNSLKVKFIQILLSDVELNIASISNHICQKLFDKLVTMKLNKKRIMIAQR